LRVKKKKIKYLNCSTGKLQTGAVFGRVPASRSFASTVTPVPAPTKSVRGMLTVDQLRQKVASGEIETVVCCFTDHYGRNMGKRFDAEFFINDAIKSGTHACNYLLTVNMNMDPIPGFKFANWENGFGDVHLVPDLNSLRLAAWQDKSAMVFCDVQCNKTHKPVDVAPRSMLRKQIDAAAASGYNIMAASELEYFLFHTSFREASEHQYASQKLRSVSTTVEDYHTLQAAREEPFNARARKMLKESGVPVWIFNIIVSIMIFG
jgi:glutamine synthetase